MGTFKFMGTFYKIRKTVIEFFKNKCKIWVHYEYK